MATFIAGLASIESMELLETVAQELVRINEKFREPNHIQGFIRQSQPYQHPLFPWSRTGERTPDAGRYQEEVQPSGYNRYS